MPTSIRHERIVQGLVFAYAALLGINIGGALFASLVVFPVWSASPEAAAAWTRPVDEARFFTVVSPMVLALAALVLLSAQSRGKALRRSMRWAGGLYVLFFVITIGYFVPGQAALQGGAPMGLTADELSGDLERWVQLNWLRQALGLLAFGLALHSLGIAYRVGSVEGQARGTVARSAAQLQQESPGA